MDLRRSVAAAAFVPAAALVLAGCGGATASTSGAAGAAASPSSAGSGGQGSGGQGSGGQGSGGQSHGGRRAPAASGEIAAASPGVLQVQNATSQTTVTYTTSTRFSQTVTATLAVGDCVTASGTPVSGSDDAVTATTVRVLSSGGGTCRLDGGGPGGRPSGGPDGPNRTPPSGAPGNGFPGAGGLPGASGAPGGKGGNGVNVAVAFGRVTSASRSTVMLSGTLRAGLRPPTSPSASPSATPTATPSPVPITVSLTSSSTVTRTVSATSAAAKVGRCATAEGTTDSKGAVAATSITISPTGPNGCSFGFVAGGRFGGGGNG